MGETNLKPCPFCGSDTAPGLWDMKSYRSILYQVTCSVGADGCGCETGWRVYAETAVKAWNRRTTK